MVATAADPAIKDLEDCYRTFGPLVRSYLRRYLPPSDVDDVLQVVFYETWRARSRYDPERSQRAWILGIARKKAIDHLRKRRDKIVPIELIAELAGEDGRECVDRFAWADEISGHLSNLTEGQRHVIVFAYYGGRTQAEIALELNIPLGTVKTRTRRGLQRLAELLTDPNPGTAPRPASQQVRVARPDSCRAKAQVRARRSPPNPGRSPSVQPRSDDASVPDPGIRGSNNVGIETEATRRGGAQ